jgi:hypothetical protein
MTDLDDAVVAVLDILGAEALDDYLSASLERCPDCGSHVETQRHSRHCPRYTVPDVWALYREREPSWASYRLPFDPKALPALWMGRVFGGRLELLGWDLTKALGDGLCTGCGDPLGADALTRACLPRHWGYQDRPCAKCLGLIDYSTKAKTEPKRLIVARIVKPAKAKELGWSVQQTNAVSNYQPQHWTCRNG